MMTILEQRVLNALESLGRGWFDGYHSAWCISAQIDGIVDGTPEFWSYRNPSNRRKIVRIGSALSCLERKGRVEKMVRDSENLPSYRICPVS